MLGYATRAFPDVARIDRCVLVGGTYDLRDERLHVGQLVVRGAVHEATVRAELHLFEERLEEGSRHLAPLVWHYWIAVAVCLEYRNISRALERIGEVGV